MKYGPMLLLALLLAGCAGTEPLRASSSAAAQQASTVAVLQTKPPGAQPLGTVSATACLNQLWRSRPGWDLALDKLKRKAAGRGANALTDIRFQDGLLLACPSSLKATGLAMRVP
jgi:hypothetical protein